jgi:hypothetical protein
MKLTQSELRQIIKEEAQNFIKHQQLQERKRTIEIALRKLEEGYDVTQEDLDEISFGGLRAAAGAIGGKIKGAANQAGAAIKKGADDVKQAYQTGADKAKYEKSQKELAAIAQKIMQLRKTSKEQIDQLQQQYSSLTGGKPFKGAVHNPVMNEGIVEWVD